MQKRIGSAGTHSRHGDLCSNTQSLDARKNCDYNHIKNWLKSARNEELNRKKARLRKNNNKINRSNDNQNKTRYSS
jgi:hypothetical protein